MSKLFKHIPAILGTTLSIALGIMVFIGCSDTGGGNNTGNGNGNGNDKTPLTLEQKREVGTVTATARSGAVVRIAWDKPVILGEATPPPPTLTKYIVVWGTSAPPVKCTAAGTDGGIFEINDAPDRTSYDTPSLKTGTSYTIRVCSVFPGESGTEVISDGLTATVTAGAVVADTTAPDDIAQSSLTAVRGSDGTSIILAWTNPTGDDNLDFAGVQVRYAEGSTPPAAHCTDGTALTLVNPHTNRAEIENLGAETVYWIRICTFDGATPPNVSEGTTIFSGIYTQQLTVEATATGTLQQGQANTVTISFEVTGVTPFPSNVDITIPLTYSFSEAGIDADAVLDNPPANVVINSAAKDITLTGDADHNPSTVGTQTLTVTLGTPTLSGTAAARYTVESQTSDLMIELIDDSTELVVARYKNGVTQITESEEAEIELTLENSRSEARTVTILNSDAEVEISVDNGATWETTTPLTVELSSGTSSASVKIRKVGGAADTADSAPITAAFTITASDSIPVIFTEGDLTILDDDAVVISFRDVSESGTWSETGTLISQLTASIELYADVLVTYAIVASETADTRFVDASDIVGGLTGVATIRGTTGNIVINFERDNIHERIETFTIELTGASYVGGDRAGLSVNANRKSGDMKLRDSDVVIIAFERSSVIVVENEPGELISIVAAPAPYEDLPITVRVSTPANAGAGELELIIGGTAVEAIGQHDLIIPANEGALSSNITITARARPDSDAEPLQEFVGSLFGSTFFRHDIREGDIGVIGIYIPVSTTAPLRASTPPAPTGAFYSRPRTISINWTAVTNAATYKLYRDTDAAGAFALEIVETTARNHADTHNLESDTTYYYRLGAIGTDGVEVRGPVSAAFTTLADIDDDGVADSVDVDRDDNGLIEIADKATLLKLGNNTDRTNEAQGLSIDGSTAGCPNINQSSNILFLKCSGFELTADITLTSTDKWVPFGTISDPFITKFEGNGYKISGLVVDNSVFDTSGAIDLTNTETDTIILTTADSSKDSLNLGFFGVLGDDTNGATVQNLILEAPDVSISRAHRRSGTGDLAGSGIFGNQTEDANVNAGALAGAVRNANTVIRNVHVTSTANVELNFSGDPSYVFDYTLGGLVGGMAAGTINAASVQGTVQHLAGDLDGLSNGELHAGGIVGYMVGGQIYGAYTNVTLSEAAGFASNTNQTDAVGGIVGTQAAGGIVGVIAVGNINMAGLVQGDSFGGIVGNYSDSGIIGAEGIYGAFSGVDFDYSFTVNNADTATGRIGLFAGKLADTTLPHPANGSLIQLSRRVTVGSGIAGGISGFALQTATDKTDLPLSSNGVPNAAGVDIWFKGDTTDNNIARKMELPGDGYIDDTYVDTVTKYIRKGKYAVVVGEREIIARTSSALITEYQNLPVFFTLPNAYRDGNYSGGNSAGERRTVGTMLELGGSELYFTGMTAGNSTQYAALQFDGDQDGIVCNVWIESASNAGGISIDGDSDDPACRDIK